MSELFPPASPVVSDVTTLAAPPWRDKTSQDLLSVDHDRKGRAGCIGSKPEIVFKIASRREELYAAFRLVYENYVCSGLARPNPYRMRVTPYQLLPTTEIFIAVSRGEVICTLSLVGDGELGLPMETIYRQEVAWRRRQGHSLGEVSSLACQREESVHSLQVVLRLMSLMAQCAQRRGVNQLLIAVHPRHARFYQRFTAFESIGEERIYATVCDNPAVALALDLNRAPTDHPRLYQKFFGVPFSEDAIRYRPLSEDLRSELSLVAEASCAAETDSELELMAYA